MNQFEPQIPLSRYIITLTVGREMVDHRFIIWAQHASGAYVRAMQLVRQLGYPGTIMAYRFN